LFKLYKSHAKIENLKGRSKSARVLCELYGKLCSVLYNLFFFCNSAKICGLPRVLPFALALASPD
ncbi:MAG: hypothetical protein O7C56_05820, partial [Rickettsia endosymbiont of Ixodes persulcatus]|nr:hypothetical protein [Rickettsia endosymbiont of Ixodes persulcatus]